MLNTLQVLEDQPQIGRPFEEMEPEFRELPIRFGSSGYLAIYYFEEHRVTILAIRHQKEAGYDHQSFS